MTLKAMKERLVREYIEEFTQAVFYAQVLGQKEIPLDEEQRALYKGALRDHDTAFNALSRVLCGSYLESGYRKENHKYFDARIEASLEAQRRFETWLALRKEDRRDAE